MLVIGNSYYMLLIFGLDSGLNHIVLHFNKRSRRETLLLETPILNNVFFTNNPIMKNKLTMYHLLDTVDHECHRNADVHVEEHDMLIVGLRRSRRMRRTIRRRALEAGPKVEDGLNYGPLMAVRRLHLSCNWRWRSAQLQHRCGRLLLMLHRRRRRQ